MATNETFYIKEGDTSPPLKGVLSDADGVIDLSSCSVDFRMGKKTSKEGVIEGAATILNAAAGSVQYEWQDGDTDVPGSFVGEFVVTLSDGTILSVPNNGYIEIVVLKALT